MHLLRVLAVAVLAVLPTSLCAGSSEGGKVVLPVAQATAFADRIQRNLAAAGARVAIVARTGRDPALLPEGVRYTHVGFWVFSRITAADGSTGTGYQVHNLYQRPDDPASSHLVQDRPADFVGSARSLDVGIIVPDVRLQEKLLRVITGPLYAALHNARYSVLSNPATRQFQNCTEHTLDVVMASLYGTRDPAQIKADIGAHFTPQPIRIGGLQRLLAPAASAALTTEDHGPQVGTATFGSIARFMRAHGLAADVYRLTPDGAVRF